MGIETALILGAVQAFGAIQQGVAGKRAADYNARQSEIRAQASRQQAAADAERKRRDNVRKLGVIRANYAASGVTVEGSPLDILESSAAEGEMDALTIQQRGEVAAQGYEETAELDRFRGEAAFSQGLFSAGSSLLGGFSQTGKKTTTPTIPNYGRSAGGR